MKRVVRVRIGVTRRPGIEMSASGGEVRCALADGMEVHAVLTRLQTRHREGDLDHFSRTLLLLDELRPSGNLIALDICVPADLAGARSGRRRSWLLCLPQCGD